MCGIAQSPPGPYKVWVWDRPPDAVFEFTVGSSLDEDRVEKKEVYAALGVGEYFVFDVEKRAIEGIVEGWRLDADAGIYRPIPRQPPGPGQITRLHSERLGLDLAVVRDAVAPYGAALRAFRRARPDPVPTEVEATFLARIERLEEAVRERDARIERLEGGPPAP